MSYQIRFATLGDCMALPALERAAATVFAKYMEVTGLTPALLAHTKTEADFKSAQHEGLLWVVADLDDTPVGFAMLGRLDADMHIHEIDVHPEHARRGLGASLIQHVGQWARERGVAGITLTTYRHVPWNAPFYERMGFRILDEAELTSALRDIQIHERSMGWKVSARVAMRLELASSP
ncbi:MAG TPA: GNAT family N-acetyltransferase [Steroidobacteraceae bacterium]|nr:GNAT family N-acetyltransferase [Steroidobacteraceae bacterium]